jgi:dihydrodipicolinate synthase/N-acetylneuraminate lyase
MTSSERRLELIHKTIGDPIPRLWCPPVTHYTSKGKIDYDRMAAHWRCIAGSVRGFLVPGSTGDAWEMTDAELREVVELALELTKKHSSRLLLGALKPTADETRNTISVLLAMLQKRTGLADPLSAMKASNVCGFIICAPSGADLTQQQIEAGLDAILAMQIPVSLYQLPQITQNEVSPQVISRISQRHPHAMLFKDTSGADKIALAKLDYHGLYLVRGGEGDYSKWLKESGGPYDGLLLSAANSFFSELKSIVELLESRRFGEADELSGRLTRAVQQTFSLVSGLLHGNVFANGNKAIDHHMALGAAADTAPPPRLHGGSTIPTEILRDVGDVLRTENLLKLNGYLG